jgi:aminoglycoside 3-N-acetyltransferase
MISFREISSGLKSLGIDPAWPVIAHASLSAFGEVRGGAETLLGALLANYRAILMPAFTYKTMVIPEEGPADNATAYGSALTQNLMGEFFRPDMPADPALGVLAETLRRQPNASRSAHPILSFSGIGVVEALEAQTLTEPLAPVAKLADQDSWVLLIGVYHTANTSLHFAERLAGRPQFVRWALTEDGVKECPGFPGCPNGFEKSDSWLEDLARQVQIGGARVRAYPLQPMIDRIAGIIRQDPLAFLCDQPDCESCNAVRRRIQRPAEI